MLWRRHPDKKPGGSGSVRKRGFKGLGMALEQLFLPAVFSEQTDSQSLFGAIFCICAGLICVHIVYPIILFRSFYQKVSAKCGVFSGVIPEGECK
jgi:hypothetical protein